MHAFGRFVGSVAATFALCGLSLSPAYAWTRPGHMVTAAIAFEDLEATNPDVIDRVATLLDSHPDRGPFEVAEDRSEGRERALRLMMECARWADDARLTVYDQPSWHVQLSPIVRAEDPPPVLPASATVMDGIQAFALNARVMANTQATPAQRAVALCWVMHLAGDVHQPLHAAQLFSSEYPDGDRAGGLQFVIDPISGKPETLHWYWDDSVHRSGDVSSVVRRTADIMGRLPREGFGGLRDPAQAKDYPVWADESTSIARSLAYRSGPVGGPTAERAKVLPADYVAEVATLAEARVAVAGYRLADLLREAFPA